MLDKILISYHNKKINESFTIYVTHNPLEDSLYSLLKKHSLIKPEIVILFIKEV